MLLPHIFLAHLLWKDFSLKSFVVSITQDSEQNESLDNIIVL